MADIQIDNNNIGRILERFFDGDTTCAEEKALEDYFRSATDVPEEYECYREMFGWYASGMKEEDLPAPSPARHPWRPLLWWSSVAAVIAVILSIVPVRDNIGSTSAYDGSFIVRDGNMTTGDAEILPEIEAALLEGDCLDREIDMRMGMLINDYVLE